MFVCGKYEKYSEHVKKPGQRVQKVQITRGIYDEKKDVNAWVD